MKNQITSKLRGSVSFLHRGLMIKRFFKKKAPSPKPPARKTVRAEKPKTKTTMHQRTLTAEGWRRMMMRTRKGKKA